MAPHGNDLAFLSLPIPMRRYMQNVDVSPPCLIIVIVIFRKAAHIHNPEMGVDTRPCERRRFAAIVEPCPGKRSFKPFSRRIEFPPLLSGCSPWRTVEVVIL